MVVAGIGVDHDQLVESVQRHFEESTPTWRTDSKVITDSSDADDDHDLKVISDCSVAQYTGGLETLEKDMSNVSLGPTPMPELGHLVIGLESVGHHHEVSVSAGEVVCVESSLLSGLHRLLCAQHDDGRRGQLLGRGAREG